MVNCSCGRIAVIHTSWTDRNPGRRFYACPKRGSKCMFIGWYDPVMCPCSIEIILGLLRSKNELEHLLKKKNDENKKLKIYLFLSCVVVVVVFLFF